MTRYVQPGFQLDDVVVTKRAGAPALTGYVSGISKAGVRVAAQWSDTDECLFDRSELRKLVPGDWIYVDTKYAEPAWFEVEKVDGWDSITARRKVALFKSERILCMGSFMVKE